MPEHDKGFDRVFGSHTNAFLLSAKGSENGKGLFSESAPCNPKTPHTPTNIIFRTREQPPPYLRGQRRFVNKRKKEMGASIHQKTRRRS